MSTRHNVFISYHHENDEYYKEIFEKQFSKFSDILDSKAVGDGDIDPKSNIDTIRRIIRDDFIKDASVTVVLIGKETWKRKYVDWEIASSIRSTKLNSRTGLLGIILPTYSRPSPKNYNRYTIPPRLYDNIKCGFAKIYDWTDDPNTLQQRIHAAFLRRDKIDPVNSRDLFGKNKTGDRWQ